jgi:hypothetical protein
MPDITDLLRTGAGTPLAPLDLDDVLSRGARRTRNRSLSLAVAGATLSAVVLVTGVAVMSGRDGDDGVPPAAPPTATTAVTTGPSEGPPAALPDGTHFGLVLSASPDHRLVLDKVEPTIDLCAMTDESFSYEQVFARCWSNTNPRTRSLQVMEGAVITIYRAGNPPFRVDYPKFAAYVATRTRDPEVRYSVWELDVRGGEVVSLRVALPVLPTGCPSVLPCSPTPVQR